MRPRDVLRFAVAALSLSVYSCATNNTLAPDQVKLTDRQADVAKCNPLGFVSMLADDGSRSEALMRKRAAGLNGNTVLLTENLEGVAYRCP